MPLIAKLPLNKSFADTYGTYPTHLNVLGRKKNAVQRQIRRGGLGSYEIDFQSTLLALCETSTTRIRFFDVGAHMGLYSALVSCIFRSQNPYIVAIEPTPDTARDAHRLRRANGLKYKVIEVAVSDVEGEAELYLSEKTESSNSLNPEFRPHSESLRVPLTTIDRLVEDGLRSPTILKVDVETFEANVVRGAMATIEKSRPVITLELLPDADLTAIKDALGAMEELGYEFYRVGPTPVWEPHSVEDAMGLVSEDHRDWVCSPSPLTDEFFAARVAWQDALSLCGRATNVLVDRGTPVEDVVWGKVGHR